MLLFYGLIAGMLFGYFLQRSEVLRYDRQLGALLIEDMTILKFMLSAICVAMFGIYFLSLVSSIKMSIKPVEIGGNILGGLIFGAGWGLWGYCPGTSVGALAEGRWDSVWGISGAIVGAGLYAQVYPWVKAVILSWGKYGPLTLPQALDLSSEGVIALFIIGCSGLFRIFKKYKI